MLRRATFEADSLPAWLKAARILLGHRVLPGLVHRGQPCARFPEPAVGFPGMPIKVWGKTPQKDKTGVESWLVPAFLCVTEGVVRPASSKRLNWKDGNKYFILSQLQIYIPNGDEVVIYHRENCLLWKFFQTFERLLHWWYSGDIVVNMALPKMANSGNLPASSGKLYVSLPDAIIKLSDPATAASFYRKELCNCCYVVKFVNQFVLVKAFSKQIFWKWQLYCTV